MTNKGGWHGESKRHSLASRGIATKLPNNVIGLTKNRTMSKDKTLKGTNVITDKRTNEPKTWLRNVPLDKKIESDTIRKRFYSESMSYRRAEIIATELEKRGYKTKIEKTPNVCYTSWSVYIV